MIAQRASVWRHGLVSAIFGLTGVGTALLGAALPATLERWRLSDQSGGFLLLAAWSGSTAGVFFVRGDLLTSAAGGLGLAALGLFATVPAAAPLLPLCFLLFGIGLGITMTAISLQRSHEADRASTSVALNRLNLLWAIGAFLAPSLVFAALHTLRVRSLYAAAGGIFLLAAVFLLPRNRAAHLPTASNAPTSKANTPKPLAPWRFGFFAAAAIGLESALGSWLATYTQRLTHGLGFAETANSAFWAGLLLSRGAHSVAAAHWLRSRSGFRFHLGLVVSSIALLFAAPFTPSFVLAAGGFLGGFGLGPLYPYVLALALPRFRAQAVFVLAGVGASLVPWTMGLLSTVFHSLHAGLAAPCAALLLLLGTAVILQNEPLAEQ